MTFNFWFLTGGKNAASTIQAIQRATGPPDARPRPPLPITDRAEAFMDDPQQPAIVAPTIQNLAPRRAPAPRPQNVEILTQRARSAQGSNKERSRSPQSVSSRITGVQDLPHPYLQGNGRHLRRRFHKECGTHPFKRKCNPYLQDFLSRPPGQSPSGPQRPFSAFPLNPATRDERINST